MQRNIALAARLRYDRGAPNGEGDQMMRTTALMLLCGTLAACSTSYRDTDQPIVAQQDFDAERYLGLWYEVARFPVFFEEDCTATTAEYGPVDEDTISVLNTCRDETPDGPVEQISGTADIVAPGQLKVKFDGIPFAAGDYWVLWVDEAYETAVVGVPSGNAGWILARSPSIDAARRAKAEDVLAGNGYDPSQLYDVPHAE
ncbi:lipocalin family protein [Amaricoccus tamworthensis]|uniref:lipocalin family protein n=1 Tax=Amaricoccus tamworthensis TaxID=57002 RepID=UPI003C7A5F8D